MAAMAKSSRLPMKQPSMTTTKGQEVVAPHRHGQHQHHHHHHDNGAISAANTTDTTTCRNRDEKKKEKEKKKTDLTIKSAAHRLRCRRDDAGFDPRHQLPYYGLLSSSVTRHLKQTLPSHSYHPSLLSQPTPSFHRKATSITDPHSQDLFCRNQKQQKQKQQKQFIRAQNHHDRPLSAPSSSPCPPADAYFGRRASNVTDYLRFIPPPHLGLHPDSQILPYFGRHATCVTDPSRIDTGDDPNLHSQLHNVSSTAYITTHFQGSASASARLAIPPQRVSRDILCNALSARGPRRNRETSNMRELLKHDFCTTRLQDLQAGLIAVANDPTQPDLDDSSIAHGTATNLDSISEVMMPAVASDSWNALQAPAENDHQPAAQQVDSKESTQTANPQEETLTLTPKPRNSARNRVSGSCRATPKRSSDDAGSICSSMSMGLSTPRSMNAGSNRSSSLYRLYCQQNQSSVGAADQCRPCTAPSPVNNGLIRGREIISSARNAAIPRLRIPQTIKQASAVRYDNHHHHQEEGEELPLKASGARRSILSSRPANPSARTGRAAHLQVPNCYENSTGAMGKHSGKSNNPATTGGKLVRLP